VSEDRLRRIAETVLYEGYVLWPYRRSALKNQRRWTFGGVFPRGWSATAPDDAWQMQTECLVEGDVPEIDVRVRFLQVVTRDVIDADGRRVDELTAGGERHLSWDEARERELALGPGAAEIDLAAGSETEPLPQEAGRIVRRWGALAGTVAVEVEPLRQPLSRVRVRIENTTPWQGGGREAALRATFCSTHTVLRAAGGAFVSLTDPPDDLRAEAEACENVGTWPVLVGAPGERHTLLSSPIILPDYPEVAPESPGDLFDGGEIDELLILNVLALSDEEREEARASDPRTRELLERCAGLPPEQLLRLHGAVRGTGASAR
jgi:hydrogenase maturation protease